jgi:uncharacterized membrane protein YciS (DUF1049 family)
MEEAMAEQNFANHSKLVPAFHFFVLPALAVNLGWSCNRLRLSGFSANGWLGVIVAAAILLGFLLARMFALTVQDRVIRLEERLRLATLLPADLQPRIGEFTVSQLVALRFASDSELPALARKVLDDKITERKAIKQLVKSWRPDYLRA